MNNKSFPFPPTMVSVSFLMAFVFFYFNTKMPFNDPDTPWHIAAGDVIRALRALPLHDPWSFTAGDYPWYNIAWLWDVMLSTLYQFAGVKGVFFLSVFSLSLVIALVYATLKSRTELSEDPVNIATALMVFALWDFTAPRPQIISFLLVVLFHHLLHHSRVKPALWHLYVTLPLLMVVWVNIHGGFLAGATIYFAYLAEALYHRNYRWAKIILISGVLCFAALFINPYGWEISIATLRSLHSVITSRIAEWHPFTYGQTLGSSVVVLCFILISNPAHKQGHLADKLLAFAWLLAAMNSIRNFSLFALLSAPYLATNLQYCMKLKPLPDISGAYFRRGLCLYAAMVVMVMVSPPVSDFLRGHDFASKKEAISARDIAYLRTHYPEGRFLNSYNIGGKLAFYGRGNPKLFIDGRAGTAYPEKVLADYLDFTDLKPKAKHMMETYRLDGVILMKSATQLQRLMAQHYGLKQVYKGDAIVVLVKGK